MNISPPLVSRLPLAMRDTALTVAGLYAKDTLPGQLSDFRTNCERQIDNLKRELTEAGHPESVIDDALYAQCALLDEAVLRCLPLEERDVWQSQPLQVSRFNSHDAGEELIRRMHLQLALAQPDPLLLSIFHTTLLLGFQGKYVSEGGAADRQRLIRAMASRLDDDDSVNEDANQPLVIVGSDNARRWHFNVSPLACVILAVLLAGLVYGGLHYWLSLSINAIAQR